MFTVNNLKKHKVNIKITLNVFTQKISLFTLLKMAFQTFFKCTVSSAFMS